MTPEGVLGDVRSYLQKVSSSRTFQSRQSGRHRSRTDTVGETTDIYSTTFVDYETSEKHDP